MTLADAARHLQVSWNVVKGIVSDDLRQRFSKPKVRSPKRIAIDENYLRKKHKFLTNRAKVQVAFPLSLRSESVLKLSMRN